MTGLLLAAWSLVVAAVCAPIDALRNVAGAVRKSLRRSERKKSCAEIDREHSAEHEAQEKLRGPRCLVGIRPDGNTTLRKEGPWLREITKLRARAGPSQKPMIVDGRSVLVRLRQDCLEIHAPGRARLIVTDDKAELANEARAVDLGGIVVWGTDWIPWATRLLTGEECEGLFDANSVGWRIARAPLCSDYAGIVLTSQDAQRERWVGVGKRTRMHWEAGDRDEIGTLEIGTHRGLLLKLYLKSRERSQRVLADGTLLQRLRDAGWDGCEPVLRAELDLADLELRPRGSAANEGFDFTNPAILADQEALARIFAYAVGHPSEPSTGRYRLLDESGEVDPRWLVIQSAAAAAPVESLAQVRRRRQAERNARAEKSRRGWVQRTGEVARFDGYGPGSSPLEVLHHMSKRTARIGAEEISDALVRADALHGDLLEQGKGTEA